MKHLVMVPEPEDQRPAMARRMDVLPAPLGPTISSDSPSLTCPSSSFPYFRCDAHSATHAHTYTHRVHIRVRYTLPTHTSLGHFCAVNLTPPPSTLVSVNCIHHRTFAIH